MGYSSLGRLRAAGVRRRKKYLSRTIVLALVIMIGVPLLPTVYNFSLSCPSYFLQAECWAYKKSGLVRDFVGHFVMVAGGIALCCFGFWLGYRLRSHLERKLPGSVIDNETRGSTGVQLSELPPFNDNDYQELVARYQTLNSQGLRDLSVRKESLRREAVKALEEELAKRGLPDLTDGKESAGQDPLGGPNS